MGNVPVVFRDVRHFLHIINTSQPSNVHQEFSIFTGDIPDSILLPASVATVAANRVILLRFLLLRGASVNARDDAGNTLLHIAIMNNSLAAFNFIINRPEVDVNATNFLQTSPLFAAVLINKTVYVKKLIKKGANVNMRDKTGCIPLHYACQHSSPKLCQLLIKAGSDINAQSLQGKTPLHQASQYQHREHIHMLLYYGANATIPSNLGMIPVMMDGLDLHTRLSLFYYTFDDTGNTVELKVLTRAMILHWPVFPKLLLYVSNVTYNQDDLQTLSNGIAVVKFEHLKLFCDKFDYVIKDMLWYCCTLTNYLTTFENMKRASLDFLTTLHMFLESDFVYDITQSRCVSVSPISSLINIFRKNKFSLNTLSEVVLCFLSYGVPLTSSDLNAVYVFYGRCELFEILLHMDIEAPKQCVPCCTLYDHQVIEQSIMPYFIYDVNLNIDTFLEHPQSYLLMDLDVMLFYFAIPKLKEFFLDDDPVPDKVVKKVNKLPSVPCLVELARNAARSHMIRKLGLKNSSQFYTVMKWLPIHNVYKEILSFKKKLYCDI